jgi:hypothetical protein
MKNSVFFRNNVPSWIDHLACLLLLSTAVTRAQPAFLSSPTLTGAAYANGSYVLVEGTDWIWTSPDLTAWTRRSTPAQLLAVAFGSGAFVAVGQDAARSGVILRSTNGIDWSPQILVDGRAAPPCRTVTFLNDQFVAVGGWADYNGAGGWAVTSPDGTAWELPFFSVGFGPAGPALFGVAFGNDTYVAAGGWLQWGPPYGAYTGLVQSKDARTWTGNYNGVAGWFTDIAFGNGAFVAVGGVTIQTLVDGAWQSGPASRGFNSVAYGKGRFVAVGTEGSIQTSEDGRSWTNQTSGTIQALRRVVLANGSFLVVGDAGTLLRSADGIQWSKVPLVAAPSLTAGKLLPNGTFEFNVLPGTFDNILIQASADQRNWITIATNLLNSAASSTIADTEASHFPCRFYRAISPAR